MIKEISKDENDRVVSRLGETLSEILSKKHDCKVTIKFVRKEAAPATTPRQ